MQSPDSCPLRIRGEYAIARSKTAADRCVQVPDPDVRYPSALMRRLQSSEALVTALARLVTRPGLPATARPW